MKIQGMELENIRRNVAVKGFAIVPGVCNDEQLGVLTRLGQQCIEQERKANIRGILSKVPAIRTFIENLPIGNLIIDLLGSNAQPVRSFLFNKNQRCNWNIGWHQDVTIAVKKKRTTDGFNAWSIKNGTPHVQPPVAVLDQLLSVRLHLDGSNKHNGALMVSPGTHRCGRIANNRITTTVAKFGRHFCEVNAGDVLLFRPLLLHASNKIRANNHRRVIHIEYCAEQLPNQLEWSEAI